MKLRLNSMLLLLALPTPIALAASAVQSIKVNEVINIDGVTDTVWQKAKGINIDLNELPYKPNNGYAGQKSTTLNIKSMYDDEFVYFRFHWDDKTHDLKRFPWQKQANGSWIKMSNKDSTKHENTWYEDKLSVYWNVNERGFKKKGCDKSCHMVEDGKINGVADSSSGRHFTKNNEILDEWQWKSTRTNVNAQLDDGFVDSEHNTNGKWGRHTDKGTGGYYNNAAKNTAAPEFMNAAEFVDEHFFVRDDSKVKFKDTFKPGDYVGGIVTGPLFGSRGDVTAKGAWVDGYWTLEVKRKLVTGDASNDLQFDNLKKQYYFGVATYDNSQINHLYHKKSIKLTFKP